MKIAKIIKREILNFISVLIVLVVLTVCLFALTKLSIRDVIFGIIALSIFLFLPAYVIIRFLLWAIEASIPFNIQRKLSANSAAEYLSKKIIIFARQTKDEIINLKDYANIPEIDLFVTLLSFAYSMTTKILKDKYPNKKNTAIILDLIFKKIAIYITPHVIPESLKRYETILKYETNPVVKIVNEIAQNYNKKDNKAINEIIKNLYDNIVDLV